MKIAHLAPLSLLALATAAPAQYTTVQPGAPLTAPIAPGPVGVPGGRDGSIAQDSVMSSNWRAEMDARKAADARGDAAHPAKASDLVAGAQFADNKGIEVGYIKAVMTDGVVVATPNGQVKVPAEAFGRNKKGLLIGMSKADFDKLVASATSGS